MNKLVRVALPFLLALVVSVAAGVTPVRAAGPGAGAGGVIAPQRVDASVARDEVSLSEAVSQVKRRYGGRILEAETREQDGRRVHVIKVLTREGRVRTVRIPATGR